MDHEQRPHVVCISFPMQGHINPMMDLSKLLVSRGFSVTFVNTEFHIGRLKKSAAASPTRQEDHATMHTTLQEDASHQQVDDEQGDQNIRLVGISDGVPPHFHARSSYFVQTVLAFEQNMAAPFSQLIEELNSSSSSNRVSFIVFDVLMSWAEGVASNFAIPCAALWTSGAACFAAYCHIPRLLSEGVLPVRRSGASMNYDAELRMPGLPKGGGFRVNDLPSFLLAEDFSEDAIVGFIVRRIGALREAKRQVPVLMNTVHELDAEVEEAMRRTGEGGIPVTAIGPLFAFSDHHNPASLWPEDRTTWAAWLDERPPNSVLYVSFGSAAALTLAQAHEISLGLLASKQPFLWAFRPDLVLDAAPGDIEAIVAASCSAGVGLVLPWLPQMDVLAHPSVGGFLSHAGWNSAMEAMWAGKPLLCFPQFAEQRLNTRMLHSVWQVGKELVPLDDNAGLVSRAQVASHVVDLLTGRLGVELRQHCVRAREVLREAVRKGGSSSQSIHRFISTLPVPRPENL